LGSAPVGRAFYPEIHEGQPGGFDGGERGRFPTNPDRLPFMDFRVKSPSY